MSYITYRISISLLLVGFLLVLELYNVDARRSSSKVSGSSRSNVKLSIPEGQRMSCLAKLLCGVQMSASSTSTGYTNQAFLLRKYFETYPVQEPPTAKPSRRKGPSRKDSVSPDTSEDDLDDDDDSTSDESDETREQLFAEMGSVPGRRSSSPSKRSNKGKTKDNRDRDTKPPDTPKKKKWQYPSGHVFDTGVPIIEREPPLPPRAMRQHQPKFMSDILTTVRAARELASKSVRNCNIIEGCSFTFKQVFVSLQEDSNNIMGNENIVALSDAEPVAPKNPQQRPSSPAPVPIVVPFETKVVEQEDAYEPEDDEPIFPASLAPEMVINDDEDEADNADSPIYSATNADGGAEVVVQEERPTTLGVEQLFAGVSKVGGKARPKRPSPVSVSPSPTEGPRPFRTTPSTVTTPDVIPPPSSRPRPVYKRPSSAVNNNNNNNEAIKKIVNYQYKKPAPSQRPRPRPSISSIGTKAVVAPPPPPHAAERPETPSPPTPEELRKYQIQKKPTKYVFEQDDEDYDESRDTYDEEAQFEGPVYISDEIENFDNFDDEQEYVSKKKKKKNKGKETDEDEEEDEDQQDKKAAKKKQKLEKKKKKQQKKRNKKKNKKNKKGNNNNNENENNNNKKFGGQGGGWHQPGGHGGWGQQGGGQHGGWGMPPPTQRPILTEIGGRPLVPEPENPLAHIPGFNGATAGWAVLYRNGNVGKPDQKGSALAAAEQTTDGNSITSSTTPVSVPTLVPAAGGRSDDKTNGQGDSQQHQEQQKVQVPIQGPTPLRTSGFSISTLASPFVNLGKLIKQNGFGPRNPEFSMHA